MNMSYTSDDANNQGQHREAQLLRESDISHPANTSYNQSSSGDSRRDLFAMAKSKDVLIKVAIDVAVLLAVGFPILFFFVWGEPYQRGFFCDDLSLRHPFHDSTVRNWMLYIVGLILPIGTMIFTEVVLARKDHGGGSGLRILGRNVPEWVKNAYSQIGVFGFGAACSQLTTDIAKYSIGRFRPHFYTLCNPIMPGNTTCDHELNQGRYIEEFECGNHASNRLLKEMRLSFPSGHSSFSAYTLIYLAIYLQARMTWRGSTLLRHFLQYLFLMMTWFTCLSRVSDYKHHWSDVLAGAMLGVICALLVANYISDLFTKHRRSTSVLPVTTDTRVGATASL